MSTITVLTDFGYQDPYVGIMKGVIINIFPGVKILDISHDIPSFSIKHTAFSLFSYYKYFPKGTIHLVVVDPGVGSLRKAIVVEAGDRYFVLPDNGIITYVWNHEEKKKAYILENEKYFLKPISNTFHGRDIFSPVAAYIAKGVNIEEFGSSLDTPLLLPPLTLKKEKSYILGEIIYIDKFGNAVTNIEKSLISRNISCIRVKDLCIKRILRYYGEAEKGEKFGLFGSTNFLELSENQGKLSDSMNLEIGDKVQIIFGDEY